MTNHRERAKEISKRIGANLKMRRVMLGISQQELSKSIGVTFQQLQKYENGQNRVPIAALIMMCNGPLQCPITTIIDVETPAEASSPNVTPEAMRIAAKLSTAPDYIVKAAQALVRSI